jgi:hypothetical protein
VLNEEIRYEYRLRSLKRWLWIYFFLLIFEGVLRKWIFPGLSGPLLLIRDPVALIIYYQAYRAGKLSMRTMWPFALITAVLLLLACIQVSASIISLPIVLFGLRSYLLHLPLMFVIAGTLDGEDLYKFGRWLMLLSVPMMALILAQYNSPRSSWLNAGAGEGAHQIVLVNDRIRPAGTFTFGIGAQCLVVLTAAFLLDALMHRRKYPPMLVGSALLAVIATVPLLGSRTVLFNLAMLAVCTVLSGMSHGARLVGMIKLVCVLLLGGLLAIQFSFFNSAIDTMKLRWEQAASSEGNAHQALTKRVWEPIEAGGELAGVVPFLGKGMGFGSRFAAASQGNDGQFLAGEGEWERVIVEFGPLFGLLFLGMRVGLAGYVSLQAFQAMRRNSVLAWLLLPAAVPLIALTVMEQPTFLGFMVFGGGLCLAAARCEELFPAYLIYAPGAAYDAGGIPAGKPNAALPGANL